MHGCSQVALNLAPHSGVLAPAALCRLEPGLIQRVARSEGLPAVAWSALFAIVLGAAAYGAAFGAWRCGLQAAYAAVKLPAMMLGVTAVSAGINAMLAQAMGCGLSARQAAVGILISFAVTASLLGAFSPMVLFLAWQCPSPAAPAAPTAYAWLLAGNTALVGLCGLAGNVRLYGLLRVLAGSPWLAARVLLVWIAVSGLAGCELAWVASPFLARPDLPVPFLNPHAFESNLFEYLWQALATAG